MSRRSRRVSAPAQHAADEDEDAPHLHNTRLSSRFRRRYTDNQQVMRYEPTDSSSDESGSETESSSGSESEEVAPPVRRSARKRVPTRRRTVGAAAAGAVGGTATPGGRARPVLDQWDHSGDDMGAPAPLAASSSSDSEALLPAFHDGATGPIPAEQDEELTSESDDSDEYGWSSASDSEDDAWSSDDDRFSVSSDSSYLTDTGDVATAALLKWNPITLVLKLVWRVVLLVLGLFAAIGTPVMNAAWTLMKTVTLISYEYRDTTATTRAINEDRRTEARLARRARRKSMRGSSGGSGSDYVAMTSGGSEVDTSALSSSDSDSDSDMAVDIGLRTPHMSFKLPGGFTVAVKNSGEQLVQVLSALLVLAPVVAAVGWFVASNLGYLNAAITLLSTTLHDGATYVVAALRTVLAQPLPGTSDGWEVLLPILLLFAVLLLVVYVLVIGEDASAANWNLWAFVLGFFPWALRSLRLSFVAIGVGAWRLLSVRGVLGLFQGMGNFALFAFNSTFGTLFKIIGSVRDSVIGASRGVIGGAKTGVSAVRHEAEEVGGMLKDAGHSISEIGGEVAERLSPRKAAHRMADLAARISPVPAARRVTRMAANLGASLSPLPAARSVARRAANLGATMSPVPGVKRMSRAIGRGAGEAASATRRVAASAAAHAPRSPVQQTVRAVRSVGEKFSPLTTKLSGAMGALSPRSRRRYVRVEQEDVSSSSSSSSSSSDEFDYTDSESESDDGHISVSSYSSTASDAVLDFEPALAVAFVRKHMRLLVLLSLLLLGGVIAAHCANAETNTDACHVSAMLPAMPTLPALALPELPSFDFLFALFAASDDDATKTYEDKPLYEPPPTPPTHGKPAATGPPPGYDPCAACEWDQLKRKVEETIHRLVKPLLAEKASKSDVSSLHSNVESVNKHIKDLANELATVKREHAAALKAATKAATDAATGAASKAATDAALKAATKAATDAATKAATKAATDAAAKAATKAATDAATKAATKAATDAAAKAAAKAAPKPAAAAAAVPQVSKEVDKLVAGLQNEVEKLRERVQELQLAGQKSAQAVEGLDGVASEVAELREQLHAAEKDVGDKVAAVEKAALTHDEVKKIVQTEAVGMMPQPIDEDMVHGWVNDKLESTKLSEGKLEQVLEAVKEQLPGVSLNEKTITTLIDDALELYAADTIGKVDFALNAEILQASKTYVKPAESITGGGFLDTYFPSFVTSRVHPPEKIVDANVTPGECWPMDGSSGFVLMRLQEEHRVHPESFTLEHLPRAASHNIHSAPKNFRVYGVADDNPSKKDLLGEFHYDAISGKHLQTFQVQQSHGNKSYSLLRFEVTSNHGDPRYTCVYRFRVHGEKAA